MTQSLEEARKPSVLEMPSRTFKAQLFTSPWENDGFKIAGTLDGFIDLAVPKGGTYPLNIDEAKALVVALNQAIEDVKTNCLFERDALLKSEEQ